MKGSSRILGFEEGDSQSRVSVILALLVNSEKSEE
jgi:hypothetical protein